MGVQLVEGRFDLPPLGVGQSELFGGRYVGIENGCQQPIGLVVTATIVY
jgi:hypothetical protein